MSNLRVSVGYGFCVDRDVFYERNLSEHHNLPNQQVLCRVLANSQGGYTHAVVARRSVKPIANSDITVHDITSSAMSFDILKCGPDEGVMNEELRGFCETYEMNGYKGSWMLMWEWT